MTRSCPLRTTLWISASVQLVYFSLSHWLFHREFFFALGIRDVDLESPFLISQLQLIGVLVMGYSLMNLVIARDVSRYRPLLVVILVIGSMCVTVFVASVWAGRLPAMFLINAGLVLAQIVLIATQFPPSNPEYRP